MAKQKYYVVWKGRQPGIFYNWKDCEAQIKGFDGARYKAYESENEAVNALASGPPRIFKATTKITAASAGKPVTPSISVDAACSGNPGDMEYQGVDTASKKLLFHQGPFPQGTVNIGEFLAIVHGLGFLKQRGLNIPVYSDSMTAIKWVKDKKANTKLVKTKQNAILFELIERAENWLKNNSYENPVLKWHTLQWGEIAADFGRK